MKPYTQRRHGEAEYNRFTTVPSADVPTGAARTDEGTDHFAELVWVSNTALINLGGVSTSGIPSAAGDGDTVNAWFNEYGQLVIAGYNPTTDTLDVTVTNDPMTSRLGPITNIDAVGTGATYTGEWVNLSLFHNATVQIFATEISSGTVDVIIEHSLDGTNAVEKYKGTYTEDSEVEVNFTNVAMRYVRVRFENRTEGTITALIYAGN